MEATMTISRSSHKIPPSLVIIATAIIVMAASAAIYCNHAVQKHGTAAELVRRCLEDNDPLQTWVKMDASARIIHVCRLTDGRYGVQFRDSSGKREISSFLKDKMTKLSQVENWLRNIGAERVYYP